MNKEIGMAGMARWVAAACAALIAVPLAPLAAEARPSAEYRAINDGNAEFGLRLYKKLRPEDDGNVFISPMSIAGVFGPLRAGANGETLAAIDKTLGFGNDPTGVDGQLGTLLQRLEQEGDGATLSIANALWIGKSANLRREYLADIGKAYDVSVAPIDFSLAEAAAEQINQWAIDQTRGRIANIVSPASFTEQTRLVLANAIYMLADWDEPFEVEATVNQPFRTISGRVKRVPLMHGKMNAHYLETPDFQAVDLPYQGDRLAMTIFLPRRLTGLASFEKGLTSPKLRGWLTELDAAGSREVEIFLPRFQLAERYELKEPLQAIGLGLAFSDEARFDRMTDQPLKIDSIIQKTFLKVDERGTEAAAVTALAVVITGMRKTAPPPIFRADHPFFLLIRDRSLGTTLFMGRVGDPAP
jgi:serine protease inhibitor